MARFGRRFPVPQKHVWTNTIQPAVPTRAIVVCPAVRAAIAKRTRRQMTHVWTNTVQSPIAPPIPVRTVVCFSKPRPRRAITARRVWKNDGPQPVRPKFVGCLAHPMRKGRLPAKRYVWQGGIGTTPSPTTEFIPAIHFTGGMQREFTGGFQRT